MDVLDKKERVIQQHQDGGDINKLIEQLGKVGISTPNNAIEFNKIDYERKNII